MRTRLFGATAAALFLSIVGSWAQAPAPSRFQNLSSRLKIIVIEGKDAANVIDTRAAVQPVVEVRDADERPVGGAAVLFAVPKGKGGFGAGDVLQLTVTTTDDGRAAATQLVPLAKGPMQIWVAATYQSLRTGRTIPQINFKTAAEAIKAGKGGGTVVAGGLKIAILEGEDGVNIVQNKTAVQPVVEVKDRNNLPIAGAVVTFAIVAGKAGFGGGGKGATKVAVTTDANGRAAVKDLQPAGTGAMQIAVEASFAGQTAKTSMSQENFQTVKDALKAGKKPGSSATDPEAESESANGGDGSQADANNSQNNSQNRGGGGGRNASGGGGGGFSTLAAVLGAVGAGASAAAAQQAKTNRGPDCTAQENAMQTATNNQGRVCSTGTFQQCQNATTQAVNAVGAVCQCYGPDLPVADRQAIQQLIRDFQSLGVNASSLNNCAR